MNKTARLLVVFGFAASAAAYTWGEETAQPTGPGAAPDAVPAQQVAEQPMQAPASVEQPTQALTLTGAEQTATVPAVAQESTPPPVAETTDKAAAASTEVTPPTMRDWLDQVRAQRRAQLEKHKKSMEARHDALSPWGTRPHEHIEKQREMMREARQRRELAQRAYRRWTNPYGEYLKDLHEARRQAWRSWAEAERKQMDLLREQQEQEMFRQEPYGWNNPWYYQGY